MLGRVRLVFTHYFFEINVLSSVYHVIEPFLQLASLFLKLTDKFDSLPNSLKVFQSVFIEVDKKVFVHIFKVIDANSSSCPTMLAFPHMNYLQLLYIHKLLFVLVHFECLMAKPIESVIEHNLFHFTKCGNLKVTYYTLSIRIAFFAFHCITVDKQVITGSYTGHIDQNFVKIFYRNKVGGLWVIFRPAFYECIYKYVAYGKFTHNYHPFKCIHNNGNYDVQVDL